jgi:hypothetical protein
MSTSRKIIFTWILVLGLLTAQARSVFAASNLAEGDITGSVTALACDTDPDTQVTTILVTLDDTSTVRIDPDAAEGLGLISVVDGAPDCSEDALAAAVGTEVTILAEDILENEPEPKETRHPVGAALAMFFSDIVDYSDGFGFGVIAQALWLTQKLEGDAELLGMILEAKQTGDYSAFVLEDGSTPANWGQFRKAVLGGDKKNHLGVVMSNQANEHGNGNGQNNGQGDGNNGNNGHGQNNGNQDKDKENKGKNKDK